MVDIIGYPNYTISEKGEIYSKKRKIIMKQQINEDGYFQIGLRNNGNKKNFKVHRLLYQAFKLEIGEEMPNEVDHENGIKTDNSLKNLRGATSSQNKMNRGTPITNTSGHKNIDKTKWGTFEVRIMYITRYSKTFKTIEEAIEHRDIKIVELHGVFANNGETINI